MERNESLKKRNPEDLFRNLSPLDHRYYLANKDLFEKLSDYLSEEAAVRYQIMVEAALLKVNLKAVGKDPSGYAGIIDGLSEKIAPAEVYEEEEKTQHNIRALVNVMKAKLPPDMAHLVHVGATSVDILDTAQAMRFRDAVRDVILPLMMGLEDLLVELAGREAGTPQVGRTHGQHAVPITFGWAVAEYVARFGKSIEEVERLSKNLRGKLAGAVGSYNATSLFTPDPEAHEREFLAYLGLEPSEHSTQLVEPEYQLRLFLELNTAFGIVANLADDLRHLQRSEIGEVRESFGSTQVGSSTMPQKRNPWNSEHVKSLWKAFAPRILTFYMDQISEHQRDLTNSASSRFAVEYFAGFAAAVARMTKVVKGLFVDAAAMKANIASSGDLVLSEAAYVLLAGAGVVDAHEVVRKATLACEKNGTKLADELRKDKSTWSLMESRMREVMGVEAKEFFMNPEAYHGRAEDKTRRLAGEYREKMKRLREVLS
jgi:adenylosuccinate lyase